MPISPRIIAREICRVLECKPVVVYAVTCPWCHRPKSLILNTADDRYTCVVCRRKGDLTTLYREVEEQFLWEHREFVELMKGPGVQGPC